MISLDQALGIYTDKINAGEEICVNYFIQNLSQEDIKDFEELSEIIKLTMSISYSKKFQDVFDELDSYKEQFYSLPSTVNFRKDSKDRDKDNAAKKTIDKLFDEEFGDDE